MERTIKILLLIVLSFGFGIPVYSDTVDVPVQAQIDISQCIKTYPVSYDKLYYLTLAGVNEYNYSIKEIQTRGGYIIFETGNRKYLASIVYVSSAKSMLKITPYSGNYDFPLGVVQNIFKYIDTYQNVKF